MDLAQGQGSAVHQPAGIVRRCGKLTTAKWAAIAKCSTDTALRDISDLLARGVLRKLEGGGRSTGYELRK